MADLVTLTHPSGGFTVEVSPLRAEVLRKRGYTDPPKPAAKQAPKKSGSK